MTADMVLTIILTGLMLPVYSFVFICIVGLIVKAFHES